MFNNALGKLINNYGRTEIGLYSSIVSLIVTILANYLFVMKMGLGIAGTGYSTILSALASTIVTLLYIFCSKMRETLVCPDHRVFENSCEFLGTAFPNVLMLCLDWWVFELMIVFSGWLGVN